VAEFDAILLLSFGGPEGPQEVMPFLRNVVRGKNVPEERLKSVAHHYDLFGGISPINEQNRNLMAALKTELSRRGVNLPIYWGNRNWHPMLEDTVESMSRDGVKNAVAFATAAYSSFSSCRQYLEDIERARKSVGAQAPDIVKIKPFFNQPDFIAANADRLKESLCQFGPQELKDLHVAFTAHSIPMAMADACQYHQQLTIVAQAVAQNTGVHDWKLVYQSRSGPASVPWLEPDICDHIKDVQKRGVKNLAVAPIGFVSDHMEVVYDLDTEAAQLARELSIKMVRAQTVGTHPVFVGMICDLLAERLKHPANGTEDVGESSMCAAGCCSYAERRVQPGAEARQ